MASRAMRQISVDYARTRAAQKRGGNMRALSLDEDRLPVADRAHELVALDRALTELESVSERRRKSSSCGSLAAFRSKKLPSS